MLEKFIKETMSLDIPPVFLKLCLYILTEKKDNYSIDPIEFCEKIYITKKKLYNAIYRFKPLEGVLSYDYVLEDKSESIIINIYDMQIKLKEGAEKKATEEDLIKRSQNINREKLIFEFWKEIMKKTNRTVFDNNRKKAINNALRDYSFEDCRKAIIGCSLSPFYMGEDPITNGKKHNDLDLIFRNSKKIEGFIEVFHENF